MERKVADIVRAARSWRARRGYDGVEVMGSEGYFLNQFLVAHTNRRTDGWGGDYGNRMRLPVETVARVRAAMGQDAILVYRISLIDLVPDGPPGTKCSIWRRRSRRPGQRPEHRHRLA